MARYSLLVLVVALGTSSPAHADETHPQGIKLDGTLGSAGQLELPGPDYEIKAEYGRQTGANLFHSIEQFNLHSGERAVLPRCSAVSPSWLTASST